jgi:hypothetical protein
VFLHSWAYFKVCVLVAVFLPIEHFLYSGGAPAPQTPRVGGLPPPKTPAGGWTQTVADHLWILPVSLALRPKQFGRHCARSHGLRPGVTMAELCPVFTICLRLGGPSQPNARSNKNTCWLGGRQHPIHGSLWGGSPSRNKGGVWGAAAPQGANEPPQVAQATASMCFFRSCIRFCTARQES